MQYMQTTCLTSFTSSISRVSELGLLNIYITYVVPRPYKGWSGGAMVLGKLPVPGRPTIWMTEG